MAVKDQARTSQAGAVLQEGAAAHRAGNLPAAEQAYRRALKHQPNDPDALHLLGLVLNQKGDRAGGIASVRKALAVRDDFPDAHLNIGIMLAQNGDPVAAAQAYRKALYYRPSLWAARLNLAQILFVSGRANEVAEVYRAALRNDPQAVSAHVELARTFRKTGDMDEMRRAVEAGLRAAPQNSLLNLMAAEVAFSEGRFKQGWSLYNWRFRSSENAVAAKAYPLPLWRGEPLAGRSILVWMEQGVGDEMMYAGMLPDIIATAARCVVQCSARLAPLFRRSFPTAEILDHDLTADDLKGIDFQCPAGSLGEWLRPEPAAFPTHSGYLKADPAKRDALRAKYRAGIPENLIVGVSWRSQAAQNGADKSLNILEWGPILHVPGLTFVNLQYGDCAAELTAVAKGFGISVIQDDTVNSLNSIDDYAAQVAAMDIVVSSSNTAVHTAGALGVPAICMLPRSLGLGRRWYWFPERDTCLWYPGTRLLSQAQEGQWLDVIRDAGIALLDFAADRGVVPSPPAYLRSFGRAFTNLNRPDDAEAIYRRLEREPGAAAEARFRIAELQQAAGKTDEALRSFAGAIAADPGYWQAHNSQGVLLAAIGRFEDAIEVYREGLRHNPSSPELRNNIATALGRLGHSREALEHLEQVIGEIEHLSAFAGNAIALNTAATLNDLGDTGRAIEILDRLIARAPDNVDAHYNRAQTLLSMGRFEAGWAEAAWRLLRPIANVRYDSFPQPRWNGQDLSGKKILIWTEQGIGDEILLATMVPDAIRTAKHVTLLCSERLVPLMRRAFPEATVAERKEPLPKAATARGIDFQMSFADLGSAFRRNFADFPERSSILKADPERTAGLRRRYGARARGRPLIGLAWSSLKNYEIGWLKSGKLPEWAKILTTPGVTFVSLQYGDRSRELAEIRERFGIDIVSDPDIDGLTDMDGFAAQVAAMDLVISVSNTTVHTAGALGVPTWVLLAEGRGRIWYWFRERTDSPWYPSLRLLRQAQSGEWASVIEQCAQDLKDWVAARTQS